MTTTFDTTKRLGVAVAIVSALGLSVGGAAFAQGAPTLSITADTVSSTRGCIETNVFERSDLVVFRAEAFLNGKEDPAAKLAVHIQNGPTLPMTYGAHGQGANAPHFWSAAWPIPLTEPTGIVNYTITAQADGETATWQQFPVPPSMLTVVPYQYTVTVHAQPVGNTVRVEAAVDQTVTNKAGKIVDIAMAKGKVVAELGLEGNVDTQGALIAAKTARLAYNPAKKAWVGTISAAGLAHGLYVVVVNAQDTVAPPNTGTGTSLAFDL